MKSLEQLLIRGRALARSARAMAPGRATQIRPVRLVLRLNDIRLLPNLVRATGPVLSEAQWRDAVVRFVQWLGPVRVTFSGGEPALSPRLEPLLRFANRLECPTHLVTGGGLDEEACTALVDRGLGAVTVLVGGVDEATHKNIVGTEFAAAVRTLEGFRDARARRGRPVGLYVGVPLAPSNIRSVGAVGGWARQAGADGVLATLPLGQAAPEGAIDAVASLGRDNLTPAHLLRHLAGEPARPHGGLRAELLQDGTFIVSSHVPPIGNVREGDPQALWEAADEAIRAARAHARPWDEVELVPRTLYSRR